MRVQFHEVIGFVILGVLLLAGVYVQVSELYNDSGEEVDFDAQSVFVGQVRLDEPILEEGIGGDSLKSAYVSKRDNKASTNAR